MKEENKKELAEAILDQTRLRLINELSNGRKYINELVKALKDIDRAKVSYHLGVLEGVGLVGSKYEILQAPCSPGRAARYYTINRAKLDEAVEVIRVLLPSRSK